MINLEDILVKHQKWLMDEDGKEQADLRGADLRGTNLRGANFCEANFCEADLRGANFCEANLCGANLCEADLRGANLCGANLCGANLCEADLRGADLCGANLCEANLREANLRGANLCGAKNIPFIPMVCPEIGGYTAFKKAEGYIVVLYIPEDAARSSATNRKCRASKARVLRIENLDGSDPGINSIHSDYDMDFIYEVGKTVEVPNFDPERWNECAPGIHHFINRQEAVDY